MRIPMSPGRVFVLPALLIAFLLPAAPAVAGDPPAWLRDLVRFHAIHGRPGPRAPGYRERVLPTLRVRLHGSVPASGVVTDASQVTVDYGVEGNEGGLEAIFVRDDQALTRIVIPDPGDPPPPWSVTLPVPAGDPGARRPVAWSIVAIDLLSGAYGWAPGPRFTVEAVASD